MGIKKITNYLYTRYCNEIKIPFQNKKRMILNKFKKTKRPNGVNIIGHPKGESGLSEHVRYVTNAFRKAQLNFCLNEYEVKWGGIDNSCDDLIIPENQYNINLFCLNGINITHYRKNIPNDIIASQFNIGYGYWELSKLPNIFKKQFKYVNEMWAPSKFIYDTLKKATDLPVYHMPIPVDFNIPEEISRGDFNLPSSLFLYIFTFNIYSFVKRKNPEAVIKCFKKAFDDSYVSKVGLVIKLIPRESNPDYDKKLEEIISLAEKDNIFIINENLDRNKMLGLINCCDVYVSLHRSEGFGLGMAEAMKMGKNVIGTAYSGNMDFMNEDNSCLVPYKLIEVKEDDYQFYEKDTEWADPDLEIATEYMKKLYEDREYRNKLSKKGQEYMDKFHSFEYIGKKYEARINEILKNMK
jgi:glycosyltransferase involved in cell wall biosynthesis